MVCDRLKVVKAITPPIAQIFNYCWNESGKLGTVSCPMPTVVPSVKAGTIIDIKTDIANGGTTGKVMVVFKIDGVSNYTETNTSLGTYPSGGLWSPTYFGYTMPTKNVSLTIEAYNWDVSKNAWVLGPTKNTTISMTSAGCTNIDLIPFSASINIGEKVDLIVMTTPGNVAFPVTFKDRSGTTLGTCKTSGTGTINGGSTCGFTWDSNLLGKIAGTYYVKAISGNCISTESVIVVNQPIRQWNFGITVVDSVSGLSIQGATVLVATAGKASQSKLTGSDGFVSFRMDEGTISVAISKDKYNTFNTVESLYMDVTRSYQLIAIPPTPTTGDVQFVSVPSGVEILIDGKTTGQKTPMTITGIPAGSHKWTLKLSGYNDSNGDVIVQSGGLTQIYVTLTTITPTMGSLNINSYPVMDAEVWIDGKNTGLLTSGLTIVTDIPPGTHSYKVTLSGYKDSTGKFDVKAGQTTTLNVEMIPLIDIGTLEITSEPSGARIWLDEKDTQRVTPATIVNLVKGDHKYKAVLSGYKEISGVVSIIPGGTKVVHLILEKSGLGLEIWAGVAIAGVAVLSFLKSDSGGKK
jgi:hypothetical protein